MRDKRFIAAHRGGPLSKEQHVQLMHWACHCMEMVLSLLETIDERLTKAITVAKAWAEGNAPTGDAMKASAAAHAAARATNDPVAKAIARAIGQGVATAHMADHSLGAAIYALIATKHAGLPISETREVQNELLPPDIRALVLSARDQKEQGFRILRE